MKTFTQKLFVAMLLCASLSGVTTMSYAEATNPNAPVSMVTTWDKTFAKSDRVEHRKAQEIKHMLTWQRSVFLKTVATVSWPRLPLAGHLARSKNSPASLRADPGGKRGL